MSDDRRPRGPTATTRPSATPPRLTVLAARDADVAVVLRRGPTDWARLSLWDTATDELEHGGWLRGRVDGRRCDLSPDGRLFVAFVAAHGTARERAARERREASPVFDTWVAISRPPWWRALALWWNGTTWDLGGFFPDATSCAIGPQPPDRGDVPVWFDTSAPIPHPRPGGDWTTRTVPHNRRHRDGWTVVGDGWWERRLVGGGHAIVREVEATGSHTGVEAALRWGDELVPLGTRASLDVDRAGRALVARDGRVEVHTGPDLVTVVGDLAGQRPDPTPAPSSAARWPTPG